MDYKKIRLELYICISKLIFRLHDIYLDAEIIYSEIIENKLSNQHIDYISKFIYYNNMLINLTNKYEINVLNCVDYKINKKDLSKNDLSQIENEYFIYNDLKNSKSEYNFYIEIYSNVLHNFKRWIIDDYDNEFNKLKCSKFYSDPNYKLTPNEEFYSLMIWLYYQYDM